MFKKLSIVLLVLAFAGLVWAKDVVVDPATLPTDMAPNINRTPTPNHGSDLMWDIQFDYNIQDATPPV
jgi:hypothetical protein